MQQHLVRLLPLVLFVIAASWVLSHQIPGGVKFGMVVVAYVLALQWLGQYSPVAARGLAHLTVYVIIGMITGIMSLCGGKR
jgi:Na+/glutamate symporter